MLLVSTLTIRVLRVSHDPTRVPEATFCHSALIVCGSPLRLVAVVSVQSMSRYGVVSVFDPWLELGKYPHIEVRFERLNGQVVGLTNGVDLIWLDDRLSQVERRCVLTHELVHVELGHAACQPLKVEMNVCQIAARKLITPRALAAAWPWSSNLFELAEELMVTPQTLRDRLHGMTEVEYAMIEGEHSEERMIA